MVVVVCGGLAIPVSHSCLLRSIPRLTMNLRMPAAEHVVATRRILGLAEPRCAYDGTCAGCNQALESAKEAALHYPACPGPAALTRRGAGDLYATRMTHEALKQAVGRALTEANCAALEEVPGLFAEGQERPGDVVVLGYCDGNAHLAIDVSCTRLITNSNLASASTSPGEALEAAEEDKRAKYAAQLAAAQGAIHFVPFIVDEFGGIGDHGQMLFETLAHRAVRANANTAGGVGRSEGAQRAEHLRRWRSYVAVAVHRVQAQVIMMLSARAGKVPR